ncbi:MAG: Archaeal PaREP1/PaREP8 family protein [Candidatus Bathyarchaeota archaeon BA1]|nr:MAG: Archaeal PaREP1/PaREP8 family protein [Candidatus Bathyarchaeota archaeon BA1]
MREKARGLGEGKIEADLAKDIDAFIEQAESFHDAAARELERAVEQKDAILFRDACEKAWNAVVQATNALFLKKNVPLAKSHWERRKRLEELEEIEPVVEKLGLLDRFSARDHHLHELGFYEGILSPATIKIELKKVRKYIEDIKSL